jgi:hypothetical protein
MQRPCDELITRPRSPADCPRYSNRNEAESFTEAAKAQNWAVKPQGKKRINNSDNVVNNGDNKNTAGRRGGCAEFFRGFDFYFNIVQVSLIYKSVQIIS